MFLTDDCWILEVSHYGLIPVWKEYILAYDHGEPRCWHTACVITTSSHSELIIHSGLTQPYYKARLTLNVNILLFLLIGRWSIIITDGFFAV